MCQSQAMQHEPCGLLRHAKVTVNFVRANSVFTANQHPESRKPFLQRDRRILEDGLNLDRKLATAVPALPALLCLEVVGIFGILANTIRASWAIHPAHRGYGINADLFVAKVLNRLLQCLWRFHARTISNWRGLVKLIITFTKMTLRKVFNRGGLEAKYSNIET